MGFFVDILCVISRFFIDWGDNERMFWVLDVEVFDGLVGVYMFDLWEMFCDKNNLVWEIFGENGVW